MATGKNKRISKGGKRGKQSKVQSMMSRKEWYDVCAPKKFPNRQFAKTICNKSYADFSAATSLRGRVFEGNLADLNASTGEDDAYRKIRLVVQEVQGRNLLTQFHGMDMTTDRICYLLRKWCTTLESVVDVKTVDGYTLRLFLIAFTTKQRNQLSRNCYAKNRLVKWVRSRSKNIITRRLESVDINQAVRLLTSNILRDKVVKRCNPIVPLRDFRIRKVKVIRTPKFDPQALLAAHVPVPPSVEAEAPRVEEAVEAATA